MTANRKFSPDNPVGYEITLTRDFVAPRELVFKAWTEENRVKEWWGPGGFDNPVCKVDARVGGFMDIHMRSPEGTVYPMKATFTEIVPHERIVFTSGALDEKGELLFDILTTVTFIEIGNKTRLTLTARVLEVRAEGAHHIGGMEMGWSGSLDKLVAYVENGGKKSTTSESLANREIVISRVFDAPRELVWEAMANPKHIVNWWGPRGFTTTIEVMDLKPGGVWKHVMRGPDGTRYPNKSIFTDVIKPERIVYTHTGSREGSPGVQFVATWSFESVETGKTRLTLRQIYETPEDRDKIIREYGAVEGGKQTLERLAEHLAKEPFVIERVFEAPIRLVWNAITDLNQMKQWYFPMIEAFRPEASFETTVDVPYKDKVYRHLWKVTEVVPGKKIAYSWKYADSPGDSIVTFELYEEGDKTRLRLIHTGLETFEPDKNPDYARGNFAAGWTDFIGTKLKEFVEKSATIRT